MELTQRFLAGLPINVWTVLGFFFLSTLTLVFSMIVASRLAGGIDFGAASTVWAKGAALLAVVNFLNFLDWGIVLAAPVWLLGLMALFSLDYKQARLLTRVNWGMHVVWKLLFLAWRL
jgi:hypothetical protein